MENKTCGECRFYHPIFKHEGVCTCTSDLHKTCDFTKECAIGGVYPKPPPTNGDVIRQGGDCALAHFKSEHKCDVCSYAAPIDTAPACLRPEDKTCMDGMLAWLNAPADSEGKVRDKKAKCAYCGKLYKKKKKAQRFCSIKCKDKWWNRERFAESEYLHPHCEDNFSGDC